MGYSELLGLLKFHYQGIDPLIDDKQLKLFFPAKIAKYVEKSRLRKLNFGFVYSRSLHSSVYFYSKVKNVILKISNS